MKFSAENPRLRQAGATLAVMQQTEANDKTQRRINDKKNINIGSCMVDFYFY